MSVQDKLTVMAVTSDRKSLSDRTDHSTQTSTSLGLKVQDLNHNVSQIFENYTDLYKLWLLGEGHQRFFGELESAQRQIEVQVQNVIEFLKNVSLDMQNGLFKPSKYSLFRARDIQLKLLVKQHSTQQTQYQTRIIDSLKKARDILLGVLKRLFKALQNLDRSVPQLCEIIVFNLLQLKGIFGGFDQTLRTRLIRYDIFKINHQQRKQQDQCKNQNLFIKYQIEKLQFNKPCHNQIVTHIKLPIHKQYILSAAQAYSKVVPVSISYFALGCLEWLEQSRIQAGKYFNDQEVRQQSEQFISILHYFQPKSKNFHFYNLNDLQNQLPRKQLENILRLNISFNLAQNTKSCITQLGQIFLFSAKSNEFDSSFYQYDYKRKTLTPRPSIPQPRKGFEIVYMKRKIYLIGGQSKQQKSPRECFYYQIDSRTWKNTSQMNVGVRNCSLASFQNRYLLKLGGLNEFDYIDKTIQCYDTQRNGWVLVKLQNSISGQSIEFMQSSFALELIPRKFLIFGGKNMNGQLFYKLLPKQRLLFLDLINKGKTNLSKQNKWQIISSQFKKAVFARFAWKFDGWILYKTQKSSIFPKAQLFLKINNINQYMSVMQRKIQQQIAALSRQSPSRRDQDFYQRKAQRLQNQLTIVQNELTQARNRLLKAQDFQIKYEYTLRQLQSLSQINQSLMTENLQLKNDNEDLLHSVQTQISSKNGLYGQLTIALNQIQLWRKKYFQLQKRKDFQIQIIKSKGIIDSNLQIQQLRNINSKLQLQIRAKEENFAQLNEQNLKINSQSLRIENQGLKNRIEQLLKQKQLNQQVNKDQVISLSPIEKQFQKNYQNRLVQLENLFLKQQKILTSQSISLRQIIQIKNKQIQDLNTLDFRNRKDHALLIDELKSRIENLQQQLFKVKRIGQLQLYQVKDELINTAKKEVEGVLNHHKVQNFHSESQIQRLKIIILEKEKQIQTVRKAGQQLRKDYIDQIKRKQEVVEDAKRAAQQDQKNNDNQSLRLQISMRNIQEIRDSKSLQYHNNLAFLDSQLKRALSTINSRNQQISCLIDEIQALKIQQDQQLKEADLRWRVQYNQRKQDKEILYLELNKKQTQWISKTISLQSKIKELEHRVDVVDCERNKLRLLNDSLQSQYKTLISYAKDIQRSLRGQKQKGTMTLIQVDTMKRDKINMVQKLKIDLEANKMAEIDIIRNQLQLQIFKKTQQNDKLRRQLQSRQHLYLDMQTKLKKYESRLKESQHIKQRLVEGEVRGQILASMKELAKNNNTILGE